MSPGCKSCHFTFHRKWCPCLLIWKWGWHHSSPFLYRQHFRQPILGVQRGNTCYIVAAEQGKQVSRSFTLIGCHHYALPVNVMAQNISVYIITIYIYTVHMGDPGQHKIQMENWWKLQFEKVDTLLKFNMEPENEPHHRIIRNRDLSWRTCLV